MKFSSSTVFLMLLGIFVLFCLFSNVKSRLTEYMTTDNSEEDHEGHEGENDFEDVDDSEASPDYEYRKATKKTKTPPHMDPKNKVKVEPFTLSKFTNNSTGNEFTCVGVSGTVKSAFGCCADGSPMTDAVGTNCAGFSTCNFGFCLDSSMCKIDAEGSNCGSSSSTSASVSTYKTSNVICMSASGPVRSGYGCCMDGSPMTDATGKNCEGVVACNYGTCPNSSTCKTDSTGSNCSQYPPVLPQSCTSTIYGCCPDGKSVKNADGSNCASAATTSAATTSAATTSAATTSAATTSAAPTPVQPTEMYSGVTPYNTSTVLIPPPIGNALSPASCPKPEPCPPCGRCPEAAFDCKKVPNYDRTDNEKFVPQAILSDFSTFGM